MLFSFPVSCIHNVVQLHHNIRAWNNNLDWLYENVWKLILTSDIQNTEISAIIRYLPVSTNCEKNDKNW